MWIAILGMHRSGTSAIAGVLQTLGYQFGETKQALVPTLANPKGYWERQDVMEVNDALLAHQGCAWDQLTRFNVNAWVNFHDAKLEERMQRILAELDRLPAGFIKDPRLCLTIPVWARISQPVLLIWVRRSPLAVARSLYARKDCSVSAGLALWEVYEHAIQTWSQHQPTIQVHFEAFQADPWGETQALAEALGRMGVPLPTPPDRAAISAWFEPGLIRNASLADAGYLCPPQYMLNYHIHPVQQLTSILSPPPLSAFTLEHLSYHEKFVRPLETEVRQTESLRRTAAARVTQLEDRLARLEKAEAAFAHSRLWRIMRCLHHLGCRLTGRPGNLHPMDKIHDVLHEESRPEKP